ncbi:MAG: hypothetical protein J1F33_03330 [Clostridiales bacterium]|nr:hypothetical protein [Clostridiales bacterium]
MYNKISRASGILLIVAAALFIGFLIKIPLVNFDTDENALGILLFVLLFGPYGMIIAYIGSVPFVICAIIFGILMLKQKSRQKLISLNKRILIANCVLLPFVAIGLAYHFLLFSFSAIDVLMIILTVAATLIYVACVVTPIVTMVLLKKSPEESAPPPVTENQPE